MQAPRLGWDCQQLPQAQQTSPQPGCAPQKAGGAPSSSCSVHVPSVLRGCWCQAAWWCRALGRGYEVSVQDVSCPSPKTTSSWESGVLGFRGPWLCSAPSPATRMGDGGCVVAGKQIGRSSYCGAGRAPSSLTQGPRAGLGRVLVLGLVLSLENKPHICLQLLRGFSLAPAGFAHLRQRGKMPQSRSLPCKAHAFQPEHWLSLSAW